MSSFTLEFLPSSTVEQAIKSGWRTYEKCFIGDILVKDIVNTNDNYIDFFEIKLQRMLETSYIDNELLRMIFLTDQVLLTNRFLYPITIFPNFVHGNNLEFLHFITHPGYKRMLIYDFLQIKEIEAIYFTSREYYPLFIRNMRELDPFTYLNNFDNLNIEIYPFAGSLVPQFRFSVNDVDDHSYYENIKPKFRKHLEKRLKLLPSHYKSREIVNFLLDKQ
jgi:hypothetical protein